VTSGFPPKYENAAAVIARGGVIAFRTDTFYGLGADPFNAQAVAKIRTLKGREEAKPILILVSSTMEVDRFIQNRTRLFDEVAERFWPGPITLIGEARPELPNELTSGSQTIGVRWSDDARASVLVESCGGALTATSANPSGREPARTAEQVRSYFPTGVDLIVDDGRVASDQPSTVLDLSAEEPKVVREGAVRKVELEKFLQSLR
jgi:L-threonylcarbamoyladenylate synthase